ncbi:aminoglycoside phosphotransferase family protein [Paenibacillus sp. 1001270B_150601_E10]|uniref:aminoglycoside phosphotransferase family protein n=1 Tax=Paenibacillus sp. 1001270B_150601_E10 TaxID=2787079 RepID=UPI00189ED1B8|nr:aminoglycoside phosphotransferase family protein [Paenibacillus sp. 1001270B_150601_E10]
MMEINNRIASILKDYYEIDATCIQKQTGGWSALAFLIEDTSKKYFLKVYSKKKPSSVQWTEAIDRYIPVVKWMHDHTELNINIVSPICTRLKCNKCEDEEYVYLLSEYIEGTTIGEESLRPSQINELAKILGVLHKNTSRIPYTLNKEQVKERFDIDFCELLSSFINNDLDKQDDMVLKTVKPYTGNLLEKIDRMKFLSSTLKRKSHKFVLCHADAHNWNIMQGQNLMLIDWECLKLAPQEQDLILIITESYAEQFLNEYKKYMNYETPDFDAFEFYYLKRKLEDIWEWIKDLRFEGLVKSEDITLNLLQLSLNECIRIDSFRSDLKKIFKKDLL